MGSIDKTEHRERLSRAQRAMVDAGLDVLLITSEANHRYLTGHATQAFRSTSRPIASVIPVSGDPLLVVASSHVAQALATSWSADILAYTGFERQFVDAIRGVLLRVGPRRIGYEGGAEQRLGLSHVGFLAVQEGLIAEWLDATALLQRLRGSKSSAEVDTIEHAARILAGAFDIAARRIAPGVTEHEVYAAVVRSALEAGADRIGYFAMHSGPGSYDRLNGAAGQRVIQDGDLVWMDVGCEVEGYWADLTYLAAVGSATAEARSAYGVVRETTETVLSAISPGVVVGDLAEASRVELAGRGATLTSPGRIGHGIGLQLTEWPSISPGEPVVLSPGMTIAIEPAWNRADGHFVTEQNLVVTDAGVRRLGPPPPLELPIVPTAD